MMVIQPQRVQILPKAWIQDRKRDYYYQKAKAEQYRSRATYKLSQTAAILEVVAPLSVPMKMFCAELIFAR